METYRQALAEAAAAAETNRASDEQRLKEVIVENTVEFPDYLTEDLAPEEWEESIDPTDELPEGLPREAYTEPINEDPGEKPDVLGLKAGFIYAIADVAKLSRGKVRRVLKAFEPAFLARIQEAMIEGYNMGIEATIAEYGRQAELEHSNDPEGSEGREESLPSEA